MYKKNYKGRVLKRKVEKCEGVCRTYDRIAEVYADELATCSDVKSFRCNVFLEGLEEGDYTSDFVITKDDGRVMVRECVFREYLSKPLTMKLLEMSCNYWKIHGVEDWGIVINAVND